MSTSQLPPPTTSPDQADEGWLRRAWVLGVICLCVLAGSVVVGFVRAPRDGLTLLQALFMLLLGAALLARRWAAGRLRRRRDSRDAGFTRMLQGMSRSASSDALVQTMLDELRRSADADHVVVARLRRAERVVETTLVSSRARVPASRFMLPASVLDPAQLPQATAAAHARDAPDAPDAPGAAHAPDSSVAPDSPAATEPQPGDRPEQSVADDLARRVAEAYGLPRTLARPLVAGQRIVGALIISRRQDREWADADRRLLGWAAQELSAALARAYAFEDAENRANIDALTGLPNRRYLEELLAAIGPHRRAGEQVGALMIDIDHFKRLNDRYGHAAGDRVLAAVGERIASAIRADDTPARYGGEEFAVVLRRATREQALEVAERVRQGIARMPAAELGTDAPITVSVGVAVAEKGDLEVSELLEAADVALYRAKRLGRNRVVLA